MKSPSDLQKGCGKYYGDVDRHCGDKYGYFKGEKRIYIKKKTGYDIWYCPTCQALLEQSKEFEKEREEIDYLGFKKGDIVGRRKQAIEFEKERGIFEKEIGILTNRILNMDEEYNKQSQEFQKKIEENINKKIRECEKGFIIIHSRAVDKGDGEDLSILYNAYDELKQELLKEVQGGEKE